MTASTVSPPASPDPDAGRDVPAAPAPARHWELSQVFVLRHAGMPFDWVEELIAPPELLLAATALLEAESRLLESARRPGLGRSAAEQLRAGLRALRVEAVPREGGDPDWAACRQHWAEAVGSYLRAFETADEAACDALREVLSRESVREAVFLSNPQVYQNMLVPFVDRRQPLNARWRRARRQLYTYVQRFCAKNETVSFFGPMAYGRTVPDDVLPDGVARLRTDLPRRRRVFLSHWAAREVALAVGRDGRLRAMLPVRRTGAPLPPDVSPWLSDDVWDSLLGTEGASLTVISAAIGAELREVALRVQPLVAHGYLEFGLVCAPYELEPLTVLAATLHSLPGAAAAGWAAQVDALAGLLRAVGDTPFPARIEAVAALERAFTALTGQPARRGSGAVYADRAVFYEECSSPFGLEVSEQVARHWAERISAALELSAAHGAATQRQAVRQVAEVLGPDARLSLPEYAEQVREAFDAGTSRFGAGHAPNHSAAAWPEAVDRLLAEAAQLPGDRYALIDLCPATADVTRLDHCELVLSRCHHHLLTEGWLGTMFPAADGAGLPGDGAGLPADHDGFGADAARWVAAQPGLVGLDVGRRNKGYYRFPGRRLALRTPSGADRADPALMWPAQLTVRTAGPEPGEPWCTDARGDQVTLYLPLSDYVKYPPYAALSHPQVVHAVFADPAGTPQITVGDVVYQRPRTVLDPAELTERRPAARFLQLRRVARTLPAGQDRFLFCRTESERKPYLIDLASVLAADLVAHVAADGTPVLAEQLRPGPGELWLRDEQGRRYTSELRVQAIGREATR